MQLVLFLALLLGLVSFRVNAESVTLTDPDGDYVQIFHSETELIEAFKKAGYVDQDPMVKYPVIHQKSWCVIENQKDNGELKVICKEKGGKVKKVTIEVKDHNYSGVPAEVARIRKKKADDGIHLLTKRH